MTPDQLTALREMTARPQTIAAGELRDYWRDRTLAYGYTVDRDTWHCYLRASNIYVVRYTGSDRPRSDIEILTSGPEVEAVRCRPNKRVYPESVDFEFARVLAGRGVDLPYATFSDMTLEGRKTRPFWGFTA